ncbi:MAG: hypothetical protein ABIN69_02280 [Aestuariivirga sp.]
MIAKANCKNWERTIELLNQTLISVLNQTDENFRVLIAANDDVRPLIPDDKKIDVVIKSIAPSSAAEVQNPSRQWRDSDQVQKKLLLTEMGKKLGVNYIMYLDADDLVRNDLVMKLRKEKPRYGCILTGGWVEDAVSGKVLRMPGRDIMTAEGQHLRFDQFCGSSVILTYPETFNKNLLWDLYSEGHHNVRRIMIEKHMTAWDITEPLAIYRLNTGENATFHVSNESGLLSWLESVLLTINSKGRNLTASERRSFGLAGLQGNNGAKEVSRSE